MTAAQLPSRPLYFFGQGQADAGGGLTHLVGGKGASLADMTRAGLPVPPGFTIAAECCRHYLENGDTWPEGLRDAVRDGLGRLEQVTGLTYGRGQRPLLLAVRSGAAESMPGMLDTILNVGLNPDCVRDLATGRPRAWADYRDYLVSIGTTVAGVPEAAFADARAALLREFGAATADGLDARQTETLCERYRAAFRHHAGRDVPDDPCEALLQAVEAVFRSWRNHRAVTYRKHHGLEHLPGTAVTVQAMCQSEVSGVLFTAHPVNPELPQMVIEASHGLGEAVVLGRVTPDHFALAKGTHDILERRTAPGRDGPCLTDAQVRELAVLGDRVAAYFGTHCDVEWGLAGGKFYLFQSRPIRRRPAAGKETERLRREEIERLRGLADAHGTVWVRHNLAEVLPEPTPMTWSVVRSFMSGRGGYGQMYRDLGFDPDPALAEVGVFDLVCGRPYCNLSREPRMQYRSLPFEHPFDRLKQEPLRALTPHAVFNPARATWRFWLAVPVLFVKLFRSALRLKALTRSFADRFRSEIVPPFVAEAAEAARVDLTKLDDATLLHRLRYWERRTLFDFARDSLKPTALAAVVMANLERALDHLAAAQEQDPDEAREAAQARLRRLVMNVPPDPEADYPAALRDLLQGKLDQAAFLDRFGHRGPQEMELAQPRWGEDPSALAAFLRSQGPGPVSQARRAGGADAAPFADLPATDAQKQALGQELRTLHTYLALRETAKHHLLRGYALIRGCLAELDRRYRLDGGVFFLTADELPALVKGEDVAERITRRRRERELLLRLPVPPVLFSDDLEAIGRPAEVPAATTFQGIPLSAGVAEGPALVLDGLPETLPGGESFILVCPTTDPGWTPLFVRARAVVMESGGVLSHGAIVAREFGLPAVAGLPEIHRRLKTGQRLHVDGGTGKVNVLA